jgi:thermitase
MRVFLALFLALPLLVGSARMAQTPTGALAGEVLLRVEPGVSLTTEAEVSGSPALAALLRQAGARTAQPIGTDSDTYRIAVLDHALTPLLGRLPGVPGVVYAAPNHTRATLQTPDDPVFRQQWALRSIKAPEAWDITTGAPIVIAILDTGVSSNHPDLDGKLLPGFNALNGGGDSEDDEGHGTYVAGVAAAQANNGEGIAGVCWGCQILPVKVLNARGQGSDATIATGIRWAADNGARIISMSLGGDEDNPVLRDAVRYAHGKGVLLIAASGNGQVEQQNRPNYPAAYPEVVAVAATDGTAVTGFATTGDYIDVTAPGVGVWSTAIDFNGRPTYEAQNGTSAACPHVAGVAGLMLSVRPDLTNDQLAALLTRSADDVGPPGKDPVNGYGALNALRAVQAALDPAAVQVQPATSPFTPVGNPNDGTRYFPETGHTLGGAFRAFWEQNGGLTVFGFPISQEFQENGLLVQYFERHRMEFHPENGPPYNVLLGRAGADTLTQQGRDWQTFARSGAQDGCRFFPETGQSVCGNILRAWRASGLEFDGRPGTSEAESLALFGLPLSGPIVETLGDGRQYTVQWFERARFEIHPENPPPYDVLLGLLAGDLASARGLR